MAIAKGLKFFVNGVDIAPAITNWAFNGDAELLDSTTIASEDGFRSFERGFRDVMVTVNGLFDSDVVAGDKIHDILSGAWLDGENNDLLATLPAEGNDPIRTFMLEACVMQYSVPIEVGGLIIVSGTFKSRSDIEFGTLQMSTQLNAGTTNGGSLDGGAATTNGGTLAVHLINVTATDVDVKLQDSANNSAWADVAGAVVNNLNNSNKSGSVTVTGTIRRYTRIVATVTGGNTDSVNAGFARG